MLESLLNTHVYSCDIYEIFKNIFPKEYLRTTASEKVLTANDCFITTIFFPIQAQSEKVEECWSKSFILACISLRITPFFIKM